MSSKIVVVIVTYNGLRWLNQCLGSLRQSVIPIQAVVIDNLSTDATVDYIQNNFPEVYLIKNSWNAGFGQANNIGIKYALKQDADYVFLLNQDAWIEPDTLELLVDAHKKNHDLGILSPVHLNGAGNELDGNFSKYLNVLNKSTLQQKGEMVIAGFVNAAAWLLPRETIEKVGGFDSLFVHYGEDRDYCQRVRYHGLSIGVVTSSIIYHDRVYSSSNSYRKEESLLISIALAKLKDINYSFLSVLIQYLLKRISKILKAVINRDKLRVKAETKTILRIMKLRQMILKSRLNSIKEGKSYL